MTQKSWLWTAVTIIGLAVGSYVLYSVLTPPPLPPGLLYGSGHIEGTAVTVSAEVEGAVVENRMQEGRPVQKGELLVRLDDTQSRLRLAQAQAAAVRGSEAALKEQLAVWRHHLSTAQSDLKRFRELHRGGTVSPQQLGKAEDRFHEAQGRVATLQDQTAEALARITTAELQSVYGTTLTSPIRAS